MTPDPLTPAEVDALLHPDPRTRSADLLVLRDALDRMAGALEQFADAVGRLGPLADVGDGAPPPPRMRPRGD